MPAVTRLGDQCSGHGGFPPRPSTSGSGNVFVNNIATVRVGDSWDVHTDGLTSHGGTSSSGSGTVFVNGQAVVRIGDAIDCGSTSAQGSGNVFAGG